MKCYIARDVRDANCTMGSRRDLFHISWLGGTAKGLISALDRLRSRPAIAAGIGVSASKPESTAGGRRVNPDLTAELYCGNTLEKDHRLLLSSRA
jgi:hypothetical protein